MSPGKLLLGVLAGVAVGSTLGVLYAPDRGSSTRKKISDQKNKLKGEVEGKVKGMVEGVSRKIDHAAEVTTETANQLAENGKSKLEKFEKEVKRSGNY